MTGAVLSKRPAFERVSYGAAILLGALLLFQVQPLIAKLILPWFGGSAAVWATCLLFFQVALLSGYAVAFWLSRQPVSRQKVLYLSLLALSLLSLPILPAAYWKPGPSDDPLASILGLLAAAVGLPYLVLSCASPLLQYWRSGSNSGGAPYRLFALSNAGSMLGLLSYPVLIEPHLTNRQQAWLWSLSYCGFAVVSIPVALRGAQPNIARESSKPPGLQDRILWIALAAAASALLLAMTNHLTQNIAPMPFLWVLTLSLYLLSLILCFESDRWYRRPLFFLLGSIAAPLAAFAISGANHIRKPAAAIAVICAPMFVLFMLCHGELAQRRPAASYLTTFYLMVAAGGAIGGALIGVAAPYLFNALYDPMIVLILTSAFLAFVLRPAQSAGRAWDLIRIGLLIAYCVLLIPKSGAIAMIGGAILAACIFQTARGKAMTLYAMAVGLVAGLSAVLAQETIQSDGGARVLARNFYGALAVYDQPSGGAMGPVRVLRHGSIEHGEQFLRPQFQRRPTTYFGPQSGAGLAIDALMAQPAINVGVIGLGAGTLATYARPGDHYSFYEINPNVISIAQSEFTFLRNCPAPVDIILGDARLSLERESGHQFDLLAVDAFSGDVIPVHLLTREAFQLYWRHLKPDGVLAVHVTNRHLALGPVAALGAAEYQKRAMMVTYRGNAEQHEAASDWVLATSRADFFQQPEILEAAKPIHIAAGLRPWADDYSNLYEVLR